MKYEVTINLNKTGQKIVGSAKRVIKIEAERISDIDTAIRHEFPAADLIESYTYERILDFLKEGDFVVIYTPNVKGVTLGEVISSRIGTLYPDDDELIVQPIDDTGNNAGQYVIFDIAGNEIGPVKKKKRWLEIPSETQIEQFRIIAERKKMILEIQARVNVYEPENQDDPIDGEMMYNSVITDLNADQLKRILDIFKEAETCNLK